MNTTLLKTRDQIPEEVCYFSLERDGSYSLYDSEFNKIDGAYKPIYSLSLDLQEITDRPDRACYITKKTEPIGNGFYSVK